MPEDIIEQPNSYALIKHLPQPYFTSALSEEILKTYRSEEYRSLIIPYERVKEIIPSIVESLQKMYPNIPYHNILQFVELYFGPYNLHLTAMREHDNFDQKVLSATIQHHQAHSIFYASLDKADPTYVKKIFNLVVTHDNIARSLQAKNEGIYRRWQGMRAELGILRALHNIGLKIYLPSYSRSNSLDNEVITWDIKNGIDMIAVKQEDSKTVVFLIDAKGQKMYPSDDPLNRKGSRIQADFIAKKINYKNFKYPHSLQKFLDKINPRSVFDTTIIIPTGEDLYGNEQLTSLRRMYMEYKGDIYLALKHFSEVTEEVEIRIKRSIKYYSHNS